MIDKNVKGVSLYYKIKAFGLICKYILYTIGILLFIAFIIIGASVS